MTQSLITEQKTWTDQAFMALNRDEHHYELVNREVVDVGNSGMEHGHLACLLVIQLGAYIQTHKLGSICDSSFTLKNGNKRSPDVSFVSRTRLKSLRRPPRGFG
jgi:Uma2 family endonuclease